MDGGMVYNTWPLMGSAYFPDDSKLVEFLSITVFDNSSIVQFIHRNLAYFIFFFYVLILINVYKKKLLVFYKSIIMVGLLLFLQILLGVLTLLSGVQIFIASMHQISSIFLVSSSIYLVYINSNINLQSSN
jgi:cytochrome c oxidase assembly protein subunit 15